MAKIYDIIIDTDAGREIDDSWAILTLLSLPNVRIKCISVTGEDVAYSARVVAKTLAEAGRDNIPIALGVSRPAVPSSEERAKRPLEAYLGDYSLSDYAGTIYPDYRSAYSAVLEDDHELFVLCMAPFTSLSEVTDLLERHGGSLKLFCMAGSIKKGYGGKEGGEPEYNIAADVEAARKLLSSDLNINLLPLDVCGGLVIDGKGYASLLASDSRYARTLIAQDRAFSVRGDGDPAHSSPVLYALVCVWVLVFSLHFKISGLPLLVLDDGRLVIGGEHAVLCSFEIAKEGLMKDFTVQALCGDLAPDAIPEYGYQLLLAPRRPNMDLSICECGWEKCFPFHRYGPKKRYYYIFHFVESGSGFLQTSTRRYQVERNQAFLIKPGEITTYGTSPENPWKYYWVGFAGFEAKELMDKCGFAGDNCVINIRYPEQVVKYLCKIVEQREKKDSAEYERIGYLYLLVSLLMTEQPALAVEENGPSPIKRAIEYINENYMHDIKIDELAGSVGFTRSHFYKKFIEKMNVSPKEYLTSLRLEKARGLMRSKEYTLEQIAGLVGYEDYTSFARTFRKYHGMSPKEYRENPFDNVRTEE